MMKSMSEIVQFEVEGSVATITLNRPDVLNSFSEAMALALVESLGECARREDVRALVITGAGRAFCAGQDLSEVIDDDGTPSNSLGPIVQRCYNPVIRAIRNLPKPVVAAVNGVAAGAGANLALACDFVVASEKASFIQSFCHIGLIPDSGGTFFLPRLVGLAKATELMMLGEKVKADDAHRLGMIYSVSEPERVLADANNLAGKLANMPTRGLGLIKRGINASLGNTIDEQLNLEVELQQAAGETSDYSEGVRAFLEKRDPEFTGR